MQKLTHLVLFWLRNPDSAEDRGLLVAGLKTLQAIGEVKSLKIGFPAVTEQRDVVDGSWSVSELITFDSIEDEGVYQDHPIHQAFIAGCEHLWQRVVVYDIVDS